MSACAPSLSVRGLKVDAEPLLSWTVTATARVHENETVPVEASDPVRARPQALLCSADRRLRCDLTALVRFARGSDDSAVRERVHHERRRRRRPLPECQIGLQPSRALRTILLDRGLMKPPQRQSTSPLGEE